MKRFILLLIILLIGTNSFSQKKEKFKPGVKLEENTIISDFKSSNSILFIFKDDTHLINFYLDLTKRLKKRFKKSNKKIDFNYELFSTKPFESDLNSIPKKTFLKADYDLICLISTSNFKGFDNHLIEKRKQNYDLNLKLEKSETNELVETAKINVNSYYTIITQNKNSSKLIYDLITD
jgi:hypothetical protein